MIKVVIVEPGKEPYVKVIKNTLEAMQEIVEGYIEQVSLEETDKHSLVLICNEEGKLIGLPGNRRIGNDIIAGTFFVAAVDIDSGELVSLTEDQIKSIKTRFAKIEEYTPEEVQNAIIIKIF